MTFFSALSTLSKFEFHNRIDWWRVPDTHHVREIHTAVPEGRSRCNWAVQYCLWSGGNEPYKLPSTAKFGRGKLRD
ncbi:MAG: hypothetical protein ABJZ55_24455 [Fuerstiella sp.]